MVGDCLAKSCSICQGCHENSSYTFLPFARFSYPRCPFLSLFKCDLRWARAEQGKISGRAMVHLRKRVFRSNLAPIFDSLEMNGCRSVEPGSELVYQVYPGALKGSSTPTCTTSRREGVQPMDGGISDEENTFPILLLHLHRDSCKWCLWIC